MTRTQAVDCKNGFCYQMFDHGHVKFWLEIPKSCTDCALYATLRWLVLASSDKDKLYYDFSNPRKELPAA